VISHSKTFGDEPVPFVPANIQSIRAVRQPASDPDPIRRGLTADGLSGGVRRGYFIHTT